MTIHGDNAVGNRKSIPERNYVVPESLEDYHLELANDEKTILYAFDSAAGHLLINPDRKNNYEKLRRAVMKTRPGCPLTLLTLGFYKGDGLEGFEVIFDDKNFAIDDVLMDVEELEPHERRLSEVNVRISS